MNTAIRVDTIALAKLVEQSGFKTSWIAERVGLQAQSLRLILNGQRSPSAPVLKLLALTLNTTEEAILLKEKRRKA